ncbi:MAG: methyltransferase [bacterium]|nr:methyltransferase [bacterium]
MLINRDQRETLNGFFETIRLKGKDREAKIEQILAYMEIIHANVRKYSKKRTLVFVESCAGNCYLSFLVYYYYTYIEKRPVAIHCVDRNEKLMINSQGIAGKLGFEKMYFHTADVMQYRAPGDVALVYSLHACDAATDGTLYLGLKNKAANILSVSCCQHSIKKNLRNPRYRGITKHGIFKDRIVYMVGDSLRALLLEMMGYRVDIFEFVSSRYTDKNIMIRARKGNSGNREELLEEYKRISVEFKVKPELENYLKSS